MAKKITDIKEAEEIIKSEESYIPSEKNVNEIIKLYMANEPIVRDVKKGLFSFSLRIPNMRLLNIVEKEIAKEIGDREMTRNEYNSIRNINHISAYIEKLGTKSFEEIKTVEEFIAKKDYLSGVLTAGLEMSILDEVFKFQQDEIAAFNPEYLKNS